MQADAPTRKGLFLFRPPYHDCQPISTAWEPPDLEPGAAVVWFMAPGPAARRELEWIEQRPASMPLFIVLPPPEEILDLANILRAVPTLSPRGVLPGAGVGLMRALRGLLAMPPKKLPSAVVDHLDRAGWIDSDETRARALTIFDVAPATVSIERLSRRMCESRRNLGRYFHEHQLPVPSHWLGFARSLHAAIQLQNTNSNINRVALRLGYPDGFTMSNQMKRLTGYRPSFIREHFGWEWIVEAWRRREEEGV